MIDIHCHILPGLDDGADSDATALALARGAVADGIHTVIATPHHENGRYTNAKPKVLQAVERCRDLFQAHHIPLTVLAGQEIRVTDRWLDEWRADRLLDLAGSGVVLLELPSSHVPANTHDLLHELAVLGLKAVIAHPERNRELARDPKLVRELIDRGAYMQVTSHSVTGLFGRAVQKLSLDWIGQRLVHFIASDAHHPAARPFALREAYALIAKRHSQDTADYLRRNAQCLIDGRPIERLEPAEKRGNGSFYGK
jgi:protein-tyrosine phosphatase